MTICLNMIVKNEAHVIERCLGSVKHLLSYYVIVDTGSTDGTQQIIQNYLKEIPGELVERPWVDFSHNRNEALTLALDKADYLLMIDADDLLEFSPDFQMPPLTKDYYIALQQDKHREVDTKCILLIKSSLNWKWHGVVHEILNAPEMESCELLDRLVYLYMNEGSQSKNPQKYEQYIALLEKDFIRDPSNTRTVFYLAETYFCAEKYTEALDFYEKRAHLGGSREEVFWALYRIAKLGQLLGWENDRLIEHYTRAFNYRSSRAEPLSDLVPIYLEKRDFIAAYRIAKHASGLPLSQDALFVNRSIYEWGALYQYAVCANAIGMQSEFQAIAQKLLTIPSLPASIKAQFQR